MIYDKWDKKLKLLGDDYEQSTCMPQLTKREYRMFAFIKKECKHNRDVANDEFIKEVLNSSMTTFSDEYKAQEMWSQKKRLRIIKNIMQYIYDKFSVIKEK